MKKNLMILMLAVGVTNLFSQTTVTPLEKVFENELSKTQIFINAINWGAKNTVEIKKDFEIKDEETGTIILNMFAYLPKHDDSFTKYVSYKAKFSLKIDCRDSKYRISVQNPIVVVGAEDVDMQYMSSKQLYSFKDELEGAARISKNHFNELMEWEYERVLPLAKERESFAEQANKDIVNLSMDKKNKKQIRQIEYKLEDSTFELNVLNEIIQRMNKSLDLIYSELNETINTKDDF